MKHLFFCVAAFITLTALALFFACAGMGSHNPQADGLIDGIYEGTARGCRGLIHVRLHIEGGIMSDIEILDSVEDRFVGGAAIADLLEAALTYNTADLDAVSGATESSEGFCAALADALGKARR